MEFWIGRSSKIERDITKEYVPPQESAVNILPTRRKSVSPHLNLPHQHPPLNLPTLIHRQHPSISLPPALVSLNRTSLVQQFVPPARSHEFPSPPPIARSPNISQIDLQLIPVDPVSPTSQMRGLYPTPLPNPPKQKGKAVVLVVHLL